MLNILYVKGVFGSFKLYFSAIIDHFYDFMLLITVNVLFFRV